MEIFKEFLIAVGGGATALIAVFTLLKTIFLKTYDKFIDTLFDKTLEKYRNKLNRSTTAYELLLNKEFEFYSKLDPYMAKLVPLVQDLVYYASDNSTPENRQKKFRECLLLFLGMVPEIKNLDILYQPYIPSEVFGAVADLISAMQMSFDFWKTTADTLFDKGNYNVDTSKAQNINDSILKCVAGIECSIKNRLTELSDI